MQPLALIPLLGLPDIRPGDDLAEMLHLAAREQGIAWEAGDALVIAQKIVSKAEGRFVALDEVEPSARALELAATCGKDPRLVELVLRESTDVLRAVPGVLIVRHRLGLVMANAGIDQSNVGPGQADALLLPSDPDRSAAGLRAALRTATGADVAVVIADSFGRPWRMGTCGVAIGVSGLVALSRQSGTADRYGRILQHTDVAVADEIAAAGSLLMGQAAEGVPAVLVRGARRFRGEGGAGELVRPLEQDLFQ